MDIVTLGAALNGSAEYVNSHFKGGSNIQIVDNPDGTQTINASGEVSSEDTVARAEIAAIKDGETLDSFGDVETALADKVDKVSGKGLSSNDFTNEYKDKVDNSLSTTTAAETYQPKGDYATTSDISDMATETWVGQQGFLTSADEVPEVTSEDDGKVLKASYSGGTGTYSWQTGGGGGGGTSNYNDLSNRPSVNNTVLTGNKTSAQLGLASSEQGGKADSAIQGVKLNGGSVITPDANNIVDISVPITAIQKNGTGITPVSGAVNITVPTQASDINAATATQGSKADTAIQGIKVNSSTVNPDVNKVVNITVPTTAADVSALPNTTKYAAALSLTINSSTFVMTGQLKDQNGDNLGTAQTIDLPLESVVVGGSYNSQTKKVVLTLQNGNTIEFSVADLVSGLQTELSASNKLNPAYINYDSTHRAVSDTEKSTWNSKQNAIDSSHKLSADLVDDTNATNKFATEEELEQIQTNKTNILKNKNALTNIINSSGKNNLKLLNDVGYSTTINNVTYTVNSDYTITANGTAQGQSRFDFAQYTARTGDILSGTTGGSATTYFIYIRGGSSDYCYNNGITIANGDIGASRTYSIVIADGVQVNNVIFKPMVCSSDLWNISSEYEPYCPTVAELYEMIKALQS